MKDFGLARDELRVLRRLGSPRKIQDFLDAIPQNFEPGGITCLSPRRVLRERRAHCIEGAMLAATALRLQGHRPLVVDLEASGDDYDHVIAVYRTADGWGALSKTNHPVLRYRDPVYRTVRELAMSYFNEYFLDDGRKTLRAYSPPVDLSRFDKRGWMTAEEDVWFVEQHLYAVRHFPLLTRSQIARLRPADGVEIQAGKIQQWRGKQKPWKK